jgi:hypothetical protein
MFVRSRQKSGMRVLFPLALALLSGLILVSGKSPTDSDILSYNQKDGSWDLIRVDDVKVTSMNDVTDGVYLIQEASAACGSRGTLTYRLPDNWVY